MTFSAVLAWALFTVLTAASAYTASSPARPTLGAGGDETRGEVRKPLVFELWALAALIIAVFAAGAAAANTLIHQRLIASACGLFFGSLSWYFAERINSVLSWDDEGLTLRYGYLRKRVKKIQWREIAAVDGQYSGDCGLAKTDSWNGIDWRIMGKVEALDRQLQARRPDLFNLSWQKR